MSTLTKAHEIRGTWFALISGLMYGLLGYFGITIMRTGISVFNLSFWRFFCTFLIIAVVMLARRRKIDQPRKVVIQAIINGAFFYSGSAIFFFLASSYISTGQAMIMFFIYPMWVMIMNWFFLGQPFRSHYIMAFILIIAGLTFLVDIKEVSFDIIGVGFSIMASFCYAIYIFWSKRLNIEPLNSTLFISFGCACLSFGLATFDGSFFIPDTAHQWRLLTVFTVVCTAIPIFLMLEAIKHLSSDKASLLSVFEPIFTVIFGVLLLNEVLTTNSIIGMALTIAGVMLVAIQWRGTFLSANLAVKTRASY